MSELMEQKLQELKTVVDHVIALTSQAETLSIEPQLLMYFMFC